MAKTSEDYKKSIVRALKLANKYSRSLDIQIGAMANAMRTLSLAADDIEKLTTTVVLEETRYGQKYAPHPAFKVQKDAQNDLLKHIKVLGLTAEDLIGINDVDPLIELTRKVNAAGRSTKIVKPDDGG
jgi:hypothetical protein